MIINFMSKYAWQNSQISMTFWNLVHILQCHINQSINSVELNIGVIESFS